MNKKILILLLFTLIVGCRQPWTLAATSKKSMPKYGIMFFTSESCIWCQRMKAEVWSNNAVKKQVKELSLYEIDVDKHQDLLKKYKIEGLPTVFFIKLSEDRTSATIIRRRSGYISVPEMLIFIRKPVTIK